MKQHLRRGAAALTSLAATAAGLAVLGVAGAPSAQALAVPVDDATFTWDLNNESTSGAYAPGTWNLMSAGRIGDPGQGGAKLTTASNGNLWDNGETAGWSAQTGNVTVEDLQSGGGYSTATFAGTRTNTLGANANVLGVRGETRLSFAHGTGTVDAAAGTASIQWDGDATVLFYSGMTFFYLSDPELTVESDGTGTVTATVGGYATSMDDPEQWDALPAEEVTVATLTDVEVTESGIATTPEYREVEYDAPEGGTTQTRTGDNWGAFPSSFVDFQQTVGQGPYWYSSRGAADPRKVANPIGVTFDAVPTPKVVVSDTSILPSGDHEVTVTGSGFDPTKAIGTRQPINGQPAGTYVVFGVFDDSWRPSQGFGSATRKVVFQQWATPNQVSPGTTNLKPDGTFSTTLTISKEDADAAATGFDGNYGVYTYPGAGATESTFETFTEITFAKATPTVTLSAPAATLGTAPTATVTVESEGGATGAVTLSEGDTDYDTVDLDGGSAEFTLPDDLTLGDHELTASFEGNANTEPGSDTATLTVAKHAATATITAAERRFGTQPVVVVRVASDGDSSGAVTLRRGGAVVGTQDLEDGVARFTLPVVKAGTHALSASFAGNGTTAATTATGSLKVRRAVTTTKVGLARPTRNAAGRAVVTVASPTTTPTGRVTVTLRKAGRVVRTSTGALRAGKVTVAIPRQAAGSYRVVVSYPTSANVAGSSREVTFAVR